MDLLSALMDLRVYGGLFCSVLQFNSSHELLDREVEQVVKHEQVQDSEQLASHTTTLFEDEAKVFHFFRRQYLHQ